MVGVWRMRCICMRCIKHPLSPAPPTNNLPPKQTTHPPQDQASQCVATFAAEPPSGSVPPRGQQAIAVTLRTSRLGRIQLPVHVRALGSRAKPLQVVLNARSLGPHLEFARAAAAAAAAPAQGVRASRAASAVAAATLSKEASGVSGKSGGSGAAAAGREGEAAAGGGEGGAAQQVDASAAAASLTVAAPSGRPSRASGAAAGGAASPTPSSTNTRGRARPSAAADKLAGADAAAAAASLWQSGASINFDKVPVLEPRTRELRLRNPTVIPAEIKLFIEGTNSVFEVGCFCMGPG
jgi:hypothetical protein